MQKWEEIMSKCQEWLDNRKSCVVKGEKCENYDDCKVILELENFKNPKVEKNSEEPTICPLKFNRQFTPGFEGSQLVTHKNGTSSNKGYLCSKENCEWYMKITEFPYGEHSGCVISLTPMLLYWIKKCFDEHNNTQNFKLT